MKQRTHLDWVNEINRLQGRGQVAVKLERERDLLERIGTLEKENKQLKNELENKKRDLNYAKRNAK
tara:strand:+ start:118 stop:315 length:198 start_codon:yes stop_codon:yes gene_type:complete